MERENRGRSPRNELTIEDQTKKAGCEKPHNELVRGFKAYINHMQQVHQELDVSQDQRYRTPSEIIRNKVDWDARSDNPDEGEVFSTLRYAWDVLAYDYYPPGSRVEHLAGATIQMYCAHYEVIGEPRDSIKLVDPVQVRMIDALTEAAGIPQKQGQTEFEIPEKLQHYTKWLLSKARQEQKGTIESNVPYRIPSKQKEG